MNGDYNPLKNKVQKSTKITQSAKRGQMVHRESDIWSVQDRCDIDVTCSVYLPFSKDSTFGDCTAKDRAKIKTKLQHNYNKINYRISSLLYPPVRFIDTVGHYVAYSVTDHS